jgi:hypothetical protein
MESAQADVDRALAAIGGTALSYRTFPVFYPPAERDPGVAAIGESPAKSSELPLLTASLPACRVRLSENPVPARSFHSCAPSLSSRHLPEPAKAAASPHTPREMMSGRAKPESHRGRLSEQAHDFEPVRHLRKRRSAHGLA